MIKTIFKSLFLLTFISSTMSWATTHTTGGFIQIFSLTTILQIVLYNMYKEIMRFFYKSQQDSFNLSKIKEYSKQGLEVTCPCPRASKAFVPIRLDQVNTYTCHDCGRQVAVQIDTKTFNQTEILDNDTVMQQEFEKAKKELEALDEQRRARI